MTSPSFPEPVFIPFLNPNEVDGVLVALPVQNGQKVSKGDVLATFETTKAVADIVVEIEGYVAGLERVQGQAVHSGEVLCYLAGAPGQEIKKPGSDIDRGQPLAESQPAPSIPAGIRLTQPALALIRHHHLDFSQLPTGTLIIETMVHEILKRSGSPAQADQSEPGIVQGLDKHYDTASMIIYGGGGHGKSVIELVRQLGTFHLVGVVDDGIKAGTDILGLPVLGGKNILNELYLRGVHQAVNAVGGIGNLLPRLRVFEELSQAGFSYPNVIHPTAFIEASVSLAEGIQVFPHAYLGSSTRVGFGSIINTGAIVSHDCVIGETVNLSPGAILAGGVQVGDKTLIGMGVTVNLEVKIGSGVRIGNGATIKADIPDGAIIRAGSIWPLIS